MARSLALRIGAVGGVGGGVLVLVGNIVHPRESGQLDDAENLLDVVSGSDIWVADHVVIATGITLLLGAFYGLTHCIGGRGAAWAGLGWGVAVIGVGLGVVFMLTEAVAVSALADEWAHGTGPQRDMTSAAGSAIFQLSLTLSAGAALFLFGLAPALYGAAILGSEVFPSWTGWVGVIAGIGGSIAGMVQLFTGVTTLTGLILVPLGIVVVTLWVVCLGVLMWRMSAEGANGELSESA